MDTTTQGVTARSTPARVSFNHIHCSEPSVQSCSDETAATKMLPKAKLYLQRSVGENEKKVQ
jgi:hypothetical protein